MQTLEKEKLYTVKDVSEMFNISPHTIRYYTDLGLIPSLIRDKNNNRLFNKEALNWLKGCICLKGCGMSIKDLKYYEELCQKGDETLYERFQMIIKYRDLAKTNLENAQKMLDFAQWKVEYYENIIKGKTKDDSNPLKWESKE